MNSSPPRQKWRVALVAPLVSAIAPPFWGGAQVIVSELACGLAERGHEVILYAAEGSAVPGVTVRSLGIDWRGLRKANFTGDTSRESDHAFFQQGKEFLRIWRDIQTSSPSFDLVHAHAYDWPVFAFGALAGLPVVHTLHLAALDPDLNDLLSVLALDPRLAAGLVTVSRACAASYAPFVPDMRVVYNGLPLAEIPFQAEGGDYLIFVGRLSPEKGFEVALEIARRTGRRLVIIGMAYDEEYYRRVVAPALDDPLVTYLGVVGREEVYRRLGGAYALLFPVLWEEAFGLVPLEALASGTPVVAFARGALPEIIVDGQTGFLVAPGDVDGVVAALERIPLIARTACRAHALAHFDREVMLDAYEELYKEMVAFHG